MVKNNMKITKSKLIELIKEELENVLAEQLTEPTEEQKCTGRGGKWKVKPGTDQMECVLPAVVEEAGGGYSVIEISSGETVLANVSCQAAQRKRNDLNKKASGTGKSYRMKPGGRCK
jgi:hypothetical protein